MEADPYQGKRNIAVVAEVMEANPYQGISKISSEVMEANPYQGTRGIVGSNGG